MKGVFVFSLLLGACIQLDAKVAPVALTPEGDEVEMAVGEPSGNRYDLVGSVNGEAYGKDIEDATRWAKNDLRNKAAKMGAMLVSIDETTGDRGIFDERVHIKVAGRAFKIRD
jgi:hypothetical protein